jgi:hypothetical protein
MLFRMMDGNDMSDNLCACVCVSSFPTLHGLVHSCHILAAVDRFSEGRADTQDTLSAVGLVVETVDQSNLVKGLCCFCFVNSNIRWLFFSFFFLSIQTHVSPPMRKDHRPKLPGLE